MSGLVRPLFQLENHAVGLQSHQGVELIFSNLDAVGGPLGAALMTRRLDVVGFRETVKTRFSDVMEMAVD